MALLSPLSLCLTGCNNYSPILSHIVDVIKNNFNKNPNEIKLGDVNDYNEALINFKSLLNQQQREDEIIYSQFNFIGQKGIKVNSKQILPNNESIIDWYEQGKCNLYFPDNYIIEVNEFNNANDFFTYRFQGWLTIQFTTDFNQDNISIKKGDFLQFVFNIRANFYAQASIDSNGFTNLIYLTSKPNSNSMEIVYGFIEWTINGQAMETLSIANLDEINYSKHIVNCGYYQIRGN